MLLVPQKGVAEQTISREYEIKAAYLYNFLKYVRWPEDTFSSPDSPFVICIVGENPLGKNLNLLSRKTIDKRKIVIRHHQGLEPEEIKCQMLFITRSMSHRVKDIISKSKGRPVLTVSDIDGFAMQGGIIAMVQVKNNVRFFINQKSALNSKLKLSSELLKLARKIVQ